MSTWDTDSDEERLRKLLDDPLPECEPAGGLPAWIFWSVQAAMVGVMWTLAVAVGDGTIPAWTGGAGVAAAAGILWLCGS